MAGRKRLIKTVRTSDRQKPSSVEEKRESKKKESLSLDDMINSIVEDGIEKFEKELMSLEGKEFVDRFSTLIEYVKPKLSRVEKIGDTDDKVLNFNFFPSGVEANRMLNQGETIELGEAEEI